MALLAAIAHLRLHQPDEAREILEEARAAAADIPWTATVIDYLEGRISADTFLSRADGKGEKTEAHTYIGLKASLEGHQEDAVAHFRWAVEQGDADYAEADMAQRELARLEPH
jgi:lipoprotein NlpI